MRISVSAECIHLRDVCAVRAPFL